MTVRRLSNFLKSGSNGKRFGRPPALSQEQWQTELEQLNVGASISAVVGEFDTSIQTIIRLRDDAVTPELEEQRGGERTTPVQSPEGMAIPFTTFAKRSGLTL